MGGGLRTLILPSGTPLKFCLLARHGNCLLSRYPAGTRHVPAEKPVGGVHRACRIFHFLSNVCLCAQL